MINILASLRNMITWASITKISKDDKDFVVPQITYGEKNAANSVAVYPYGYHAIAPVNSLAVRFSIQDQEENRAHIEFDSKNRIKRGLKSGEVIVGNQGKKTYIFFKEDGSIEIKTDSTVTIDGNLVVTGTITGQSNAEITGNLTVNGNIMGTNIIATGSLAAGGEITANTTTTPIVVSSIPTAYNVHTHVSNGAGNPTSGPDTPI